MELPSGEWTVKHSNLTLTGQKATLNLSVTTASAGVTSFLYDGDLHRIFAFAIIDRVALGLIKIDSLFYAIEIALQGFNTYQ